MTRKPGLTFSLTGIGVAFVSFAIAFACLVIVVGDFAGWWDRSPNVTTACIAATFIGFALFARLVYDARRRAW